MVSRVIVKLPHQTSPKGDHIPHEQKYNTRHGLQAIPNEVRRKVRRQPRQPEIQQKPVVHLLLETALGWKCGILGLPVRTPAQSPKPAHRGRTEIHSCHAPQKSNAWHETSLPASFSSWPGVSPATSSASSGRRFHFPKTLPESVFILFDWWCISPKHRPRPGPAPHRSRPAGGCGPEIPSAWPPAPVRC